MQSNVTYNTYQKHNAQTLAKIIKETWQYDRFCSKKVANQMSNAYLASCLAQQTYTMTAFVDNKPVGIIMANSFAKYKLSFPKAWMQLISVVPLLLTKEGRNATKIFKEINNLDRSLLAKHNKKYDGEIVFFALNEKCRSKGIGKTLFQMALKYLKDEQVKSYYLYTDSTCNYGFYEHMGMIRCEETVYELPFNLEEDMEFYLYEGSL